MTGRDRLRTSAPAARWPPWYRSGMTRPAMVVLACLLPSCALFGDLGPIRDKSMSDVAALEGCWVGLLGLATVEECWGRPASGTMLGHGRQVGGGKTRGIEYLRIERRAEATVLVAMPDGQQPTEFTRRPVAGDILVFENTAHDFPKRIVYFLSNTTLGVRLEGTEGGNPRVVEYLLHRY